MNAVVRFLWVICAVLVADAFAADPDASRPEGQSPSQQSSVAPLGAVAQSPASAPSVMGQKATTKDPSAGGKSEMDAKSGRTATSADTANAQTVANKSVKNVLVDDTGQRGVLLPRRAAVGRTFRDQSMQDCTANFGG